MSWVCFHGLVVSGRAGFLAGVLASGPAFGGWQDDIGYTRLRLELGPALPTGAGVTGVLVESVLSVTEGAYLPSAVAQPAAGVFAGKEFRFRSGGAPVSSHAVRAGSFFFGENTDPQRGDASVAPGVGRAPSAWIDCYESQRWLKSDFLRIESGRLPAAGAFGGVANHSWIGLTGEEFSAAQANEALRRLDWSVGRDDAVVVVGLNNGAGTAVPPLLASGYNVLSVGRTDGWHSTGTSSAVVDGAGRSKPELVAPMTATSWSTAVVSSCAGLLREAARVMAPGADCSEVMRAVLLAGARKDPFPGWGRTALRPLDPHFGAGEVNVWRSYQILEAGGFAAASGGAVRVGSGGASGWRLGTRPSGDERQRHSLRVPPGCVAREFCAALVWNRGPEGAGDGSWMEAGLRLDDLDLRLVALGSEGPATEVDASTSGAQGSASHPLEYIRVLGLPADNYALTVEVGETGAAGEGEPGVAARYGLAWFADLGPAEEPGLDFVVTEQGAWAALQLSRLGVGLRYDVEGSADLQTWSLVRTLTARSVEETVAVPEGGSRMFFRVCWRG